MEILFNMPKLYDKPKPHQSDEFRPTLKDLVQKDSSTQKSKVQTDLICKNEKLSLIELIKSDMYRYNASTTKLSYIKDYFREIGANYMFWFRVASRFNNPLFKRILRAKMIKYGIEIFPGTKIGSGFYIGHFGGIIVNPLATIGKNCNISHNVTIGRSNRGENEGVPTIGDEVFIGPGAVIIGNITIGNNVAIGANAVVTKDIPSNSVVAGSPAKVISQKGTEGYINNIL